jgi:hypothetical protein
MNLEVIHPEVITYFTQFHAARPSATHWVLDGAIFVYLTDIIIHEYSMA